MELKFSFDIDTGQHAISANTGQECQRRHPGSGAYFHHLFGVDQPGQQSEHCGSTGADTRNCELGGATAGGLGGGGLRDEGLREGLTGGEGRIRCWTHALRVANPIPCRAMSHVVAAELVANVLSIEVIPGQQVGPQDAVVVLESMKMEIPVLAEVDGTVSEIVVAAGDVVRDGDPLVVIETS